MKNIYLACPYSHPDREVRQKRAGLATYVAAHLMENKFIVFSPITHGHAIGGFMSAEKYTWDFWKAHCLSFLHRWADELHVLALENWENSVGVAAELELARELDLPITFLEQPWLDAQAALFKQEKAHAAAPKILNPLTPCLRLHKNKTTAESEGKL